MTPGFLSRMAAASDSGDRHSMAALAIALCLAGEGAAAGEAAASGLVEPSLLLDPDACRRGLLDVSRWFRVSSLDEGWLARLIASENVAARLWRSDWSDNSERRSRFISSLADVLDSAADAASSLDMCLADMGVLFLLPGWTAIRWQHADPLAEEVWWSSSAKWARLDPLDPMAWARACSTTPAWELGAPPDAIPRRGATGTPRDEMAGLTQWLSVCARAGIHPDPRFLAPSAFGAAGFGPKLAQRAMDAAWPSEPSRHALLVPGAVSRVSRGTSGASHALILAESMGKADPGAFAAGLAMVPVHEWETFASLPADRADPATRARLLSLAAEASAEPSLARLSASLLRQSRDPSHLTMLRLLPIVADDPVARADIDDAMLRLQPSLRAKVESAVITLGSALPGKPGDPPPSHPAGMSATRRL